MSKLQSNSLRCVIFALTALLFASCATASGFITEQQARDIALKISNTSRLRMLESPSSVRAELLTLATARTRLSQSSDVGDGYAPDMMVWLVTMEGTWTINGGPPTPQGATQAPQETFHQYAIILNAKTGESISERATR